MRQCRTAFIGFLCINTKRGTVIGNTLLSLDVDLFISPEAYYWDISDREETSRIHQWLVIYRVPWAVDESSGLFGLAASANGSSRKSTSDPSRITFRTISATHNLHGKLLPYFWPWSRWISCYRKYSKWQGRVGAQASCFRASQQW